MKTEKIPKTNSIKALAQFWDTHELTDFEDQLEEVTTPVFERREPEQVIKIHLASNEVEAVERLAASQGVSAGILIHDWVVQQLK